MFAHFLGSSVFLLFPSLSVFALTTFRMRDASVQLTVVKLQNWMTDCWWVSFSTFCLSALFCSPELLEGSLWKARQVEDWEAKPGGTSIVADGTGRCFCRAVELWNSRGIIMESEWDPLLNSHRNHHRNNDAIIIGIYWTHHWMETQYETSDYCGISWKVSAEIMESQLEPQWNQNLTIMGPSLESMESE